MAALVTFFKRFFSADYRRAVSAEAAGDYSEAARAYALAGEQAKVAEMHLLRAERSPSPEGRLQELRAAIRWADPADPDGRAARRRIARALFNWGRASGLISESDRQVVREAAQLFFEVSDHAGCGECHELVGDELQAAEAYQRAGDLERLEAVLAREEGRRKHKQRVSDAFEEYRLHLAGGDRERALGAIRLCVEEATGAEQTGYRRECEALEAALITDGTLVLRRAARETRYVGALPLVLGREPICQVALRDVGISRAHVEIRREGSAFSMRDLESRNGTTLAGVRLAPGASIALTGTGELGVGEHCLAKFETQGPVLRLEIVRGLDRGLVVLASGEPFALEGGGTLTFVDGRPRLKAPALHLNGVHVGAAAQLIHGDKIELGDARLAWEVP